MDEETRLEPADIILTCGQGPLSRLTRVLSRFTGEPRCNVDRAGVVVEGGALDDVVIVEAVGGIRRQRLVSRYGGTGCGVAVYRPTRLSKEEKQAVVDSAEAAVDRQPGVFDQILLAMDRLLLGVYLFRRVGSRGRYSINSWPVADAYAAANADFGVEPGEASPDAIFECVNRQKKLFWKIRDLWPVEEPTETLADSLEERILASS